MRYRILVNLLLVVGPLLLSCSDVRAQLTAPAGGTASPLPISTNVDKSSPTINQEAMIFDGAVDPIRYHVGPGDVLEVKYWTSSETLPTLVSADEELVLPRLGTFQTHGKTLAEIKAEVLAEAQKVYKSALEHNAAIAAPVTLTLRQPRRIYVKINGDVPQPGMYIVSAATHADVVVEMANKTLRSEEAYSFFEDPLKAREEYEANKHQQKLKPYIGNIDPTAASERFISIGHQDGTTGRLDLLRYNGTHDQDYNPYLREGDVIYVPYRQMLEGSIGTYGAVEAPGNYEFVKGDSLKTMIRMVHGPSPNADLEHVELTRYDQSGENAQTQIINLKAIIDGYAPDIPLSRSDRIVVRSHLDLRQDAVVLVRGEVERPGIYPISRTTTKLSQILKMSGGPTPYAFLDGASVLRLNDEQDNPFSNQTDVSQFGRLANLSVFDTANFRIQMANRQPEVVVNMQRLLSGDSTADILLRNGDVINIPTKPNTVYVSGYVGIRGFVPYLPKQNADYYVEAAGGYAEGAVRSRTRVIKAKTHQWIDPDKTVIEPGDEVYVPKEKDYPDDYSIRTIGAIAGIVGGLVYVVLAIYVNTKKP